jgi:hypothetical protein
MSGKIYLLKEEGTLEPLDEEVYASEDLLQTLLEKYPDLLAGDQIDQSEPRRWLLISREMGIPEEEKGHDRWSLDHLFLDQDGVPTLVEVKRSSDSRIRREVVGQMLDYAANAVVYWPTNTIRAKFEAACESEGGDSCQKVADLLKADPEDENAVEDFWDRVKTNLQAGKIRLVFVADGIPPELRRIVEFLNGQMDPAEVLAVEIRQYVGEGLKTLVPRVIGKTAVQKSKPNSRGELWNEERFFQSLERRCDLGDVEVARRIYEWAKEKTDLIAWGRGRYDGSFSPKVDHKGAYYWTIGVWTYGKIYILFQYMQTVPPFDRDSKRWELLERLNQIPGIDIPGDGINRFPTFPLSLFKDETVLKNFMDFLNWLVQDIRSI